MLVGPGAGTGPETRDKVLAGFAAVTLALNLPVALINFKGWSYPFTFQIGRDINPDSIWFHVPNVSLTLANLWFLSIFAFGMGWLILRTWWGARWDVAALLVIVEEAGGKFTDLSGRRTPDGGSAVSTNGLLHAEALGLLNGTSA